MNNKEIKEFYKEKNIFYDNDNLKNAIKLFKFLMEHINKNKYVLLFSDNETKIKCFIKETIDKNKNDSHFFFEDRIISIKEINLDEDIKKAEEDVLLISCFEKVDIKFLEKIIKETKKIDKSFILCFNNRNNQELYEEIKKIDYQVCETEVQVFPFIKKDERFEDYKKIFNDERSIKTISSVFDTIIEKDKYHFIFTDNKQKSEESINTIIKRTMPNAKIRNISSKDILCKKITIMNEKYINGDDFSNDEYFKYLKDIDAAVVLLTWFNNLEYSDEYRMLIYTLNDFINDIEQLKIDKTFIIFTNEDEKNIEIPTESKVGYFFSKKFIDENVVYVDADNSETNDNEVNVLLLAMSKMAVPEQRKVNRYFYEYENENHEKKEISGFYLSQMEPVPKMLSDKLNLENKKLDKIFVLNTKETKEQKPEFDNVFLTKDDFKNDYEFFKFRCKFVGYDNIESIEMYDNNKNTNLEKALFEFYKMIQSIINSQNKNTNKTVNLYVDIHGGLRDSFVIVNAILMLLKDVDNINLKTIYTVEYNDIESIIKDCTKEVTSAFNFVNGMNEFINFGRSEKLVEFVNDSDNEKNKKLVKAINNISDGILLNRTNFFEKYLGELFNVFENGDNNNKNSYFEMVEDMIKNNYIVTIGEKKYDLLNNIDDRKNLIAQLQWCLNEEHYQQALALIENRTAGYLYEKQVLIIQDEANISDLWGDWAKYSLCLVNHVSNVSNEYSLLGPNEDEEDLNILEINRTNFKNKNNIEVKDVVKQYFYFEKFLELNKINIMSKIDESKNDLSRYDNVINDITSNNVISNNKPNKEYLEYTKKSDGGNDLYIIYKKYKKDKQIEVDYKNVFKYKINPKTIPVNELILNDDSKLKDLYNLLYLYKGLKKIRNSVAHPNKKNNNILIEELREWIQFYLSQLKKIIEGVE